jgi:hypothetical protein
VTGRLIAEAKAKAKAPIDASSSPIAQALFQLLA